MGIPDQLIYLLTNLYVGQEATVRTGHGTMDWFKIGKGVCQGCILSPCLFNLYAEYIRRNAGVDSYSLFQGIFPTQGSNPGLLHCRQILYHLSHQGNPTKAPLKKTRFLCLRDAPVLSQGPPRCVAGPPAELVLQECA